MPNVLYDRKRISKRVPLPDDVGSIWTIEHDLDRIAESGHGERELSSMWFHIFVRTLGSL